MANDEPTKRSFVEGDTVTAFAGPIVGGLPSKIDRYRIDRHLGAGAMGVVYAGFDPELERPVAIKVLRTGGSPERMKREAQALAQLNHPNVVAVYDVGEHEGSTFVAMALVDGENLRTWLATPRTPQQILDAITQAARGLEVAHAAGIVHRDIKPDNIFVAKDGTVLVGDFGLARTTDEAHEVAELTMPLTELTQTGALVGTPAYMAPEQFEGIALPASDQYALCITAWEALYGKRPFTGQTVAELLAAIRRGPPSPPTRRVSPRIHAAIERGLAVDPKVRHPSIAAFAAALHPRRQRWPFIAAAIAVLAIAGVVVAFTMRDDPESACDAIAAPSGWKLPQGTPPKVAASMDRMFARYAADWQRFAKTSCIAAARRELSAPAYAATKRCLEDREDTLAWITVQPADVLGLVQSLEPVETCSKAADSIPNAELATLQRELARAAAFTHYMPETSPGLDALLARATKLDDPTSIGEASYLLALSQHAQKLDPTASLQAAIGAAERARDDRIRTRAFAMLAIVAAQRSRVAEATQHRDAAVSASARANDPVTTIAVERANAELAYVRRDVDAELAALRRIEAIQLARFGELSTAVADARFRLAGALLRTKHPDGTRVLDLAVATVNEIGGAPQEVALNRAALAEPDPAARIPIQEQIVALIRRDDPSRLLDELVNLALMHELVGSYEPALKLVREALALKTPPDPDHLSNAAHYAFEIADRTPDEAARKQHLDDALGFLAKLPASEREHDSIQAIEGRILLRAGRHREAIPLLTKALAAAEAREPPFPYNIAIRSFALAQALWEVGGTRERERAIALADQAARRLPEARADIAGYQNGALLPRFEELVARVEAWRRTHR